MGCDYYVARFSNPQDYEHVLTQGPWLIRDNYLTIRKWVPNFIPDEEPIRYLTAWVRILCLSMEYFNEQFLHTIGERIGKVVKVDRTTACVERGKFIRMSIEVDLSKPLLSKFRLHGKVWRIQYEGLKLICFNCGKIGHKEDSCPRAVDEDQNGEPTDKGHDPTIIVPANKPEYLEDFSSWMLIKKSSRRKPSRQSNANARDKGNTGKTNLNRDTIPEPESSARSRVPGAENGKNTNTSNRPTRTVHSQT